MREPGPCVTLTGMGRRLTWLTIYAVAMAYVESAVVVYLRAIYYPVMSHWSAVPLHAARS
jgi:hypothetical protein